MYDEPLLYLLGAVAVIFVIAAPILLIIAFVRSSRVVELSRRLARLETVVKELRAGLAAGAALPRPPAEIPRQAAAPVAPPPMAVEAAPVPILERVEVVPEPRDAIAWEWLIGRKALGWLAVVVLLFATGFFLRYAVKNDWIGPLGRVAIGIAGGIVLLFVGRGYHHRGWRVFSQMLTAAGVVLLYTSSYTAFGFYHLLPQREAAVFLILIIAESALLALRYESPAIALMAVIGGLLTPVLMHSDRDQYVSLFFYLGVLNVGVVGLLLLRAWPLVGTVSLLGTQGLFWAWHQANYHPAKLPWALGFQLAIWGMYFGHSLIVNFIRKRPATWEDLARMLFNAIFWSAAIYMLLRSDYHEFLAVAAVALAAIYAGGARLLLGSKGSDPRVLLTALAISAGFVALAFPLQANAPWVALGWAAEAGLLWWFGLRVRSAPLRIYAAVLAASTVVRIVVIDVPPLFRPSYVLIFNRYALPALAAAACLTVALAFTRRFVDRLFKTERVAVGLAAVVCALLYWYVVSVDLYGYFQARAQRYIELDTADRLTQMWLSAWWAVYATIVLAVGFRLRLSLLRWTALGLFGLTVLKVFIFDMNGLDEIYRIVAFFVLAVLLGLAAWAYQRFQPERTGMSPFKE